MSDVGYTLQAIHHGSSGPIVSLTLSDEEAEQIIERLWPDEDLWRAPGGCSFELETQAQAQVVNEILKTRLVILNPGKHRWFIHVYVI
jgi:hypothetical protein